LTPSPILKVLSTLTTSGVRSLLMGGQACVLYGGAEFSRDTDIVVLADDDNLGRLAAAAGPIEALSLPDLVTAKKTQRDKDWPMITRLVEADYAAHGPRADTPRTVFWLRELRTPSILIDVTRSAADVSAALVPERPLLAAALVPERPLVAAALAADVAGVAAGLAAEEAREREADRIYWAPLRQELERLRLERRR